MPPRGTARARGRPGHDRAHRAAQGARAALRVGGALSEDLRRYLDGRPILARPDTVGYRAGKFVRRHRAAVAAAAVVALALAGGVFATARQARIAERRFDEARRLEIRSVIFRHPAEAGRRAWHDPAARIYVESTLEYLVALGRDAGDDPRLLRELSASYVQLARVQGIQGNADVATSRLPAT